MAYPYLPVNPCCTGVVLNNPCGCNSTVYNNPCSTILTPSSTVVYNSVPLTSINVEVNDTLTVVLQKIDETIYNLSNKIDALTARLDICCPITTTTTTTGIPCECITFENTDVNDQGFSYNNCLGAFIDSVKIDAGQTVSVCGCCASVSDPSVIISIGDNCIDGSCPTTTTTTTLI